MGGGLIQLVAYGAQDIFLTGNPQISFFKVIYRRHTNFAIESIKQTWDGVSDGSDGRCVATISRNGDLLYRTYLELNIPSGGGAANIDNPGSHLIKYVKLEIGGQEIDKQSGDWMEAWSELTEPNPNAIQAGNMTTLNGTLFQNMSLMGGWSSENATSNKPNSVNSAHVSNQSPVCESIRLPPISIFIFDIDFEVGFSLLAFTFPFISKYNEYIKSPPRFILEVHLPFIFSLPVSHVCLIDSIEKLVCLLYTILKNVICGLPIKYISSLPYAINCIKPPPIIIVVGCYYKYSII